MKNETTFKQRIAATRFLTNEVFPTDVPKAVRVALAGDIVETMVWLSNSDKRTEENFTEEDLTVWGSDYTFRPLPDGSWAVMSMPDKLGDEWVLTHVIDAPGETGAARLPEVHAVSRVR
jgi:hypothetical protein